MFKSLKEKFTSWFKKDQKTTEAPLVDSPEKEETQDPSKIQDRLEKLEVEIKKSTETEEKVKNKKSKSKKNPKNKEVKEIKETLEVKDEIVPVQEEKLEDLKELELIPQKKIEVEEKVKPLKVEPKKEKKGLLKGLFSKKKEKIPEIKVTPAKKIEVKIDEKESFFSKIATKLSHSTLNQAQFDNLFSELEMTLLENNVALEVAEKIRKDLSKDLVGIEVKKAEVERTIISSLKNSILDTLIDPPNLLHQINKKITGPYVIILVGINGSGKTTSLAKLASYLKQNKISCVIAAADTFRAASIEQLEKHAEKLDIPLIKGQYGSDPASVAFEAKKYAQSHKTKVVLIDTAGRMYTKSNLIKEMEKIVRVSEPDLKLFVGESITGNDATEQAKTFNDAIDIDGIILTKADVDEKAGAILSVSHVTKKPIYFLGIGQKYSNLMPFTKKEVLKNLGLE